VKAPWALRPLCSILPGDAEGDQRLGRGRERVVRANGEEAAGDRRRHAAGARDGAQKLVAVGHRVDGLAVRDVIDRAGDRGHGAKRPRRLSSQLRAATVAYCLDATDLRLPAGERGDLGRVAADDGDLELVEQALRSLGPVGRGAGADGIEHDRDAGSVGRAAGDEHRLDPLVRERADVEDERPRDRRHLRDLLHCVRHHRQRAERERCVRRLVHDHVVRDLVDERLALADRGEIGAGVHRRTGCRRAHRPVVSDGCTSKARAS
jgi:hypothetical protein